MTVYKTNKYFQGKCNKYVENTENSNFMVFFCDHIKCCKIRDSVTAVEHCSNGHLARTVKNAQNRGNRKMWEHETEVILYLSKSNLKITIFNSNV